MPTVEWKVSTTGSIATLGARAYVNGAAVGSELVTSAEPTSDTTQTLTVSGLARAQLLNGALQVRVRATRGNSNTAFSASLDAVSVTVDYTVPGDQTLTSDAAGNLVSKGSDTFTYDGANRLTGATVSGVTETYTYDGDGVRFSRTVGANPAIRSVSDVNAGLPLTLDDGTRKYVWGLGLAYAVSASSVEIYHTDRLGSVRAITDATGTVTATYRTDEYGVPTAATGTSTQPFAFTGEPRDTTGLSYLRARYYDPSLGRFTSRDAWAGTGSIPTSLNRYAYVTNNPTRYADPSGNCLFLCGAVGALVGGVVGTVVYYATTPSEDWAVTDAAVSAALGAGSGFVIGFTGGVAAGAISAASAAGGASVLVESVAGGSVLVGTAGYATALLTSGIQRAIGRRVTAETVFWNVVGGVTGAVATGPVAKGVLTDVAKRLTSAVIGIGRGIAANSNIKNDR